MFSCGEPDEAKQIFAAATVDAKQKERRGFLCLLKEPFYYTVTSFIWFGKCAYFLHKGSSLWQHLDSSAFLEISSISVSCKGEMTLP